ncbi:hypothetical protein Esti_000888 [Eimeria stiedai]
MPVIRRKRTTYHERTPASEAKGAPQRASGSPLENSGAPTQGRSHISLTTPAWGPYGGPPKTNPRGAPLNKEGTSSAALRSKAAEAAAATAGAAPGAGAGAAKGAPEGAPSCVPRSRITAMLKKQVEGLSRGQRKRLAKKEVCARRLNFGVYAEALLQQQAAAAAADGAGGPSALENLKEFSEALEEGPGGGFPQGGGRGAPLKAANTKRLTSKKREKAILRDIKRCSSSSSSSSIESSGSSSSIESSSAVSTGCWQQRQHPSTSGFSQKESTFIFMGGPTVLGGPLSSLRGPPV